MSGGTFARCGECGRLVILGQTCCETRSDLPKPDRYGYAAATTCDECGGPRGECECCESEPYGASAHPQTWTPV